MNKVLKHCCITYFIHGCLASTSLLNYPRVIVIVLLLLLLLLLRLLPVVQDTWDSRAGSPVG